MVPSALVRVTGRQRTLLGLRERVVRGRHLPVILACVRDAEWYFDLHRNMAVPASERGPGDHLLGPYASRHEAESWKAKVDERNERWDEADEAWEHAGESEADEVAAPRTRPSE
jgi:hypothetical protein